MFSAITEQGATCNDALINVPNDVTGYKNSSFQFYQIMIYFPTIMSCHNISISELHQALLITETGADRNEQRISSVLENLRKLIMEPHLARGCVVFVLPHVNHY